VAALPIFLQVISGQCLNKPVS